ncbi:MAG: oligosaccharide flippase family protein [Bacteroidaceae bacterium]|nr:oligosaccharide flippase family protein [Bacteroidaceae bacterium]
MMKMPLRKYNTVFKNFTYLSILNGLNILLPLLIIPYLTNVIGAARYGVYAYILVLVQNINVVTQYGFQFSATKKISQNRDNHAFLEQYCSNILCARFLVATLCIALVLALSHWALDTSDRFFMFLTAIGMIYGDVFIPTWLFQGLERMKYMTIVNASSKILFTILIFVVVVRPEDYEYILLLNSLGFLLAAILSMVLVRMQFKIRLQKPCLKEVFSELRESLSLCFSMIGIDLYRNMNVVVLNFFVSESAMGVYALAERVIKAAQSFITPVSQALFPHMSLKIKQEGVGKSMALLKRAAFFLFILTIVVALGIFFCGDFLVSLVGKDFSEIKPLLNWMYPVLIFGCMNFLLGFVGLVNLNQQKFFFFAVFLSGTISLGLLFWLARYWGIQVAAMTMSLSEILLFIACLSRLLYLIRQNK